MLAQFSKQFIKKEEEIQEWIAGHLKKVNGPIYTSVDVRNAGYKIAPVDTNMFPGGFNNLCPSYKKRIGDLMKEYIEKNHPGTKKILFIPESHTRNKYYFSNLRTMESLLTEQDFKIRIGTLNPDIKESTIYETADSETITLHPIERKGDILMAGEFEADLYLLNNDLSGGIPELLENLAKPLVPSPDIGWHSRTKSQHFNVYNDLIQEFASIVEMDPWLFQSYSSSVDNVDFSQKSGLDDLAKEADELIKKIAEKYREYEISEVPYVFIKNNSGTYGMGITNVRSGDEVFEFNRKQRNKMSKGKGSKSIFSMIIQEGVPTVDRFNELVAEPVIYLANNQVGGGFFRLNDQKGYRGNLNSKGMLFTKLCFHELLGYSNEYKGECDLECLAKIYKTIAQIASIAAGYELLEVTNKQ